MSGHESPSELEANEALKRRVEALRLAVGPRMNLGDVALKTVPKMCLIAKAERGGALSTRNFIPHRVHEAIGVPGAVSVATACVLPGSVVDGIAVVDTPDAIDVEHPTGAFTVALEVDDAGTVIRSALLRTARKLFQGEVYVPGKLHDSSHQTSRDCSRGSFNNPSRNPHPAT